MRDRILTSLLFFSDDGHLLDELIVPIGIEELHRIYGTEKIYGVTSDKDLIGQSKELSESEMRDVVRLLSASFSMPSCATVRLMTYLDGGFSESDKVGFSLDLFTKNDGLHIGWVALYGVTDLAELKRSLGLPSRHSLVGDFLLGCDWQFSYFEKFGVHLNRECVDVSFSSYSI